MFYVNVSNRFQAILKFKHQFEVFKIQGHLEKYHEMLAGKTCLFLRVSIKNPPNLYIPDLN